MATAAADGVKQDMPPKGGYRKIHVDRVFPKPFANSELTINIVNLNITFTKLIIY